MILLTLALLWFGLREPHIAPGCIHYLCMTYVISRRSKINFVLFGWILMSNFFWHNKFDDSFSKWKTDIFNYLWFQFNEPVSFLYNISVPSSAFFCSRYFDHRVMNIGLWLVDNHFLLAIIDRLNTPVSFILAVWFWPALQCQLTIIK